MRSAQTFFKPLLITAIVTILPTLMASAQGADRPLLKDSVLHKTLATVVFGDSNTTDYTSGIVNWYERLASLNTGHPIQVNGFQTSTVYSLTFNNQSVGGKSVAPTMLG